MLRFFFYLTLFTLPTSLLGQTLVADINTKLESSNPSFLRAGEGNIFFIPNIEYEVEEICATDGEQVTLIDLLPDLAYSDKTKVKFAKVFDNVAYYGVYSSSDTLVDIYSLNLGNHTRQLLGQYAIHEFSDLLSPFLTALNGEERLIFKPNF